MSSLCLHNKIFYSDTDYNAIFDGFGVMPDEQIKWRAENGYFNVFFPYYQEKSLEEKQLLKNCKVFLDENQRISILSIPYEILDIQISSISGKQPFNLHYTYDSTCDCYYFKFHRVGNVTSLPVIPWLLIFDMCDSILNGIEIVY